MDCITFNKDIDAFIHDELNDDELNGFLNHLKTCKSCAEELEVNYIVQEGMLRMNDKSASLNLASAYRHEITNNKEYIASRKRSIVIANVFRTLIFWTLIAVTFVYLRVTFT